MRSTCTLLLLVLIACGDNAKLKSDAAPEPDAMVDAMPDAQASDGIAAARAAADGTALTLPIFRVTVTSLRPQIGSTTNDPAGFTIQAQKMGPALLVAVDPATLTPPPNVGDVISFTITAMATTAMQRRAVALMDYTVFQTATDVTPLVQDISAATDLITNIQDYDSELITVTGTVATDPASSGTGFQQVHIDTAGLQAMPVEIRGPVALMSGVDMTTGCHVTVSKAPVNLFNTTFEIGVYATSDYTLTGCAAPKLVSAVALSTTTVRLTFDRNIKDTSVIADGSQFTFDNGLTASAAAVTGRTVTVTTSAQSSSTNYMLTVANTVTDLQGTGVDGTATSTSFGGFVTPAVVRINEVNANIAGGCDLIELRVVQGGAMTGFKITERTGLVASGELSLTFTSFIVQKNDFIVVHMGSGSATCNPGGATQETVAVDEQPKATFGANFDTAYDWYSADTGLTATNNVITLYDAGGNIIDAVFLTDVSTTTIAAATLTAAGAVGAANQWTPAMATYDSPTFLAAAVDDLNATATTVAGTSIQRTNDLDTNAKADWTTGPGLASTWGALNVGQAAFP